MKNRPNHTFAGLLFVGGSILIAVVIFIMIRPAITPTSTADRTKVISDADNAADRLEAEAATADVAVAAGHSEKAEPASQTNRTPTDPERETKRPPAEEVPVADEESTVPELQFENGQWVRHPN